MMPSAGLIELVPSARGVLFDLDETLVIERRSAEEAVEACCAVASARYGDLDGERFAVDVFEVARLLWRSAPTIDYARAVGISSWEGLWSGFDGAGNGMAPLRSWSEAYCHDTWAGALGRQGCVDDELVRDLAALFVSERTGRLSTFGDVEPLLRTLAGAGVPLAVVTNGAPDTQRIKLACCGLARYFRSVWISAEVGFGKPDVRLWRLAAEDLGGPGKDLVAVGNSERNDVAPCLELGLTAARVDRATTGVRRVAERSYVVGSLSDLMASG